MVGVVDVRDAIDKAKEAGRFAVPGSWVPQQRITSGSCTYTEEAVISLDSCSRVAGFNAALSKVEDMSKVSQVCLSVNQVRQSSPSVRPSVNQVRPSVRQPVSLSASQSVSQDSQSLRDFLLLLLLLLDAIFIQSCYFYYCTSVQ